MTLGPMRAGPLLRLIAGRRGRGLRSLVPIAVGLVLPCLTLLAAASLLHATDAQSALAMQRDGSGGGGDLPEDAALDQIVRRTQTVESPSGDLVVTTIGGPASALIGLPGLGRLPDPGTVLASPAVLASGDLSVLAASLPGPVTGELPRALLARPNERVVLAVVDPKEIVETRNFSIVYPGRAPRSSAGGGESRLLAAILALAVILPCAAACITAVRVSASRRDARYATLRLIGVTPRGLRTVVAGECAMAGATATAVVIVIGALVLNATDRLVVGGWSVWTEDLRLGLGSTAAAAAIVVVVGVAVGVAASRSVAIDPVATRQHTQVIDVRRTRSIWLVAAVATPALVAATRSETWRVVGIIAALGFGAVGVARCAPVVVRAVARVLGLGSPATFQGTASLRHRAHESARPAMGIAMVVYALAVVLMMGGTLRETDEGSRPADLEVRAFDAPVASLATRLAAQPGVQATAVVSSEVMVLGDAADSKSVDVTVVASCHDATALVGLVLSNGSCQHGTILLPDSGSEPGSDGDTARLSADPGSMQPPAPSLVRSWPTSARFRSTATTPGAVVVDPSITTPLQTILVKTDRRTGTLATVNRVVADEMPTVQVTDLVSEAAYRVRAEQRTQTLLTAMAGGLLAIGSLSVAYAGWGTLLENRRTLRLMRVVGFSPRATATSISTTYSVPVVVSSGLALFVGLVVPALVIRAIGGPMQFPAVSLATAIVLGLVPAGIAGALLAAAGHRLGPEPPRSA